MIRVESGRAVSEWSLTPITVFGGWRIVWRRWVRIPDVGWDEETRDLAGYRDVIYTTAAAALDEVEALERRNVALDSSLAFAGT